MVRVEEGRKGSVFCVRTCVNTHPVFLHPKRHPQREKERERETGLKRGAHNPGPRAAPPVAPAPPTPPLSYRGDLDLDLVSTGCLDEGEDESEGNQGDQCAHVEVQEERGHTSMLKIGWETTFSNFRNYSLSPPLLLLSSYLHSYSLAMSSLS